MNRAPFQVLVIPFFMSADGIPKYCVLRRNSSTGGYWQFVAGGGELGEEPAASARRESFEEIGATPDSSLIRLDSLAMIPVVNICGFQWGNDVLVIPEYCFGIELFSEKITLSDEHANYEWLPYEQARAILNWDSNKTALWELNYRLINDLIRRSV